MTSRIGRHVSLMDLDIDLLPLSSDDDNDHQDRHHASGTSTLLPRPASAGWSGPDFLIDVNASDDFVSLDSDAEVSSLRVTALHEADDWDDFDTFFDDEAGNSRSELPESSSERWGDSRRSNVKIKVEEDDDDIVFFEEEEGIGDKQRDLKISKIERADDGSVVCEEGDYVEAGRTIPRSRTWVIHHIEQMILPILQNLARGESFTTTITSRGANSKGRVKADQSGQHILNHPAIVTKNLRFLSCKTMRRLTILIRVLSIIHEALVRHIIVTKRDIYYKDVGLFGSQTAVDQTIDDIACHFNVPRSCLNVTASSKGLVYGDLRIVKRSGAVIECGRLARAYDSATCGADDKVNVKVENEEVGREIIEDEQGHLIPPLDQIAHVETSARFVLVIEKEATFRYLISARFYESVGVNCVLVTGKGYPDIATRHFVKLLSMQMCASAAGGTIPVFALMDNDPYGLDIFSVYKFGSRSLAFDSHALACPTVLFLGLSCSDRARYAIPDEAYVPLTAADRRKGLAMLRRINEGCGWARNGADDEARTICRELCAIIHSNRKAELQALCVDDAVGMVGYLIDKLRWVIR